MAPRPTNHFRGTPFRSGRDPSHCGSEERKPIAIAIPLTVAEKHAHLLAMSDAVTVPCLGVRRYLGGKLRDELNSSTHVSALNIINAISLKNGGNLSVETIATARPLSDALDATKISTADSVLFFFLIVITSGIYLLWTFYRVSCISADQNSFYRKAMAAMNDLCQPQPAPKPEANSNPPIEEIEDGEISQLEPYAAAKSKLLIQDDNRLNDLCGEIFEATAQVGSSVNQGGTVFRGDSAYKLFTQMKFDDAAVARILRSHLADDASVSAITVNIHEIFNIAKQSHAYQFNMAPDIVGRQWNAFIVRLVQFIKLRKAAEEMKLWPQQRNAHIASLLYVTLGMSGTMNILANMLAKKLTGAFSKALANAVSRPPLSDFFAVGESTVRREPIVAFVCSRIKECLNWLRVELECSAAVTSQERLELTRGKEVRANKIREVATQLALKLRDDKTPPTKEEEANIAGALNELLGSLDATVRKLLAETPSKFVTKQGSIHKRDTEYAEGISMVQYFDALAEQWNKKTAIEGGENNGAILLRRDEVYGKELAKLRAELLSPATDESVAEFIRANSQPSA
jgi:hypothetical protein